MEDKAQRDVAHLAGAFHHAYPAPLPRSDTPAPGLPRHLFHGCIRMNCNHPAAELGTVAPFSLHSGIFCEGEPARPEGGGVEAQDGLRQKKSLPAGLLSEHGPTEEGVAETFAPCSDLRVS